MYRHTTKDGTEILLSDMTDQHLINTYYHVKRKAKEGLGTRYVFGDSSDRYCVENTLYDRDAEIKLNLDEYIEEIIRRLKTRL